MFKISLQSAFNISHQCAETSWHTHRSGIIRRNQLTSVTQSYSTYNNNNVPLASFTKLWWTSNLNDVTWGWGTRTKKWKEHQHGRIAAGFGECADYGHRAHTRNVYTSFVTLDISVHFTLCARGVTCVSRCRGHLCKGRAHILQAARLGAIDIPAF